MNVIYAITISDTEIFVMLLLVVGLIAAIVSSLVLLVKRNRLFESHRWGSDDDAK